MSKASDYISNEMKENQKEHHPKDYIFLVSSWIFWCVLKANSIRRDFILKYFVNKRKYISFVILIGVYILTTR